MNGQKDLWMWRKNEKIPHHINKSPSNLLDNIGCAFIYYGSLAYVGDNEMINPCISYIIISFAIGLIVGVWMVLTISREKL